MLQNIIAPIVTHFWANTKDGRNPRSDTLINSKIRYMLIPPLYVKNSVTTSMEKSLTRLKRKKMKWKKLLMYVNRVFCFIIIADICNTI